MKDENRTIFLHAAVFANSAAAARPGEVETKPHRLGGYLTIRWICGVECIEVIFS
jgi:hypothetical protein